MKSCMLRSILYNVSAMLAVLSMASAADAAAVDGLLAVKGVDPDAVGVYVEDIATGDVVCDYNGDASLIPASTTKILTTAAATLLMSPDCSWPTVVDLRGYFDKRTFVGDVVLRVHGDPTIGNETFDGTGLCNLIARKLRELDIDTLKGSVIVDESARVAEKAPSGWLAEDLTSLYGAVYRPANYNGNRFSVTFPSAVTQPSVPDVTFNQRGNRGRFSIVKSTDSNEFTVNGKPRKNRSWSGAFPNSSPEATLEAETRKALERAGIAVVGNGKAAQAPATTIMIHHSPRLYDVMRRLMVRSDNLLAEATLRLLSPQGGIGDALDSERRILSQAVNADFNADGVKIADGSGLSRKNRMTPYFLADVLTGMAQSDVCVPFVGLFPRAGREGTVGRLLRDTPLEGRMALKSGSMSGVMCYAGYMLDNEGLPTHVVVIFANRFGGNRATLRSAMEEMLLDIFQ